ncbi:HTH domain-containing protein [Halosimplex halophilum]|uniref:HTH domain-containing protein n=1 Tax=Halosimplex halophilum TaxID=2559572 RepID=UPI00107FD0D3|nr:HTH domain-containing protein [Halosimplex halophilum]
MQGGRDASDTRIEVYVRSLEPGEDRPQRRALDRLDALAAAGDIEGYEVVVWGDRAPPSRAAVRTRAGRFVLDRVTVFQRWAERNDASIEDAFGVRTVDSSITGERHEELVLPRLAVAAVREGRLLAVAPASVDGEHRPVDAVLDRLEDGSLPATTAVELRPLGGVRDTDTGPTDRREQVAPVDRDRTTRSPDVAGVTRRDPEPTEPVEGEVEPTGEPAEPVEGPAEPTEQQGDETGSDPGSAGSGDDRGDPPRTPYPPY